MFGHVLLKLEEAIDRTKEYMRKRGITEICRMCASETGSCCRIKAREGICVTYLCDRIGVDRIEFNKIASVELSYLSLLKVKIRRFIDQRVPRSSSDQLLAVSSSRLRSSP